VSAGDEGAAGAPLGDELADGLSALADPETQACSTALTSLNGVGARRLIAVTPANALR